MSRVVGPAESRVGHPWFGVWCERVFYGRVRVIACKDFNCGVKQRSHGCNDVFTGLSVSSWVK